MNFFQKIFRKFLERKIILTYKGISYYEYVKLISEKKLKNSEKIAAYEKDFVELVKIARERVMQSGADIGIVSEEDQRAAVAEGYCDRFKDLYERSIRYYKETL